MNDTSLDKIVDTLRRAAQEVIGNQATARAFRHEALEEMATSAIREHLARARANPAAAQSSREYTLRLITTWNEVLNSAGAPRKLVVTARGIVWSSR